MPTQTPAAAQDGETLPAAGPTPPWHAGPLVAFDLEWDGDDEDEDLDDGEPHPYVCPTCGGNGCRVCAGTGELVEWTR